MNVLYVVHKKLENGFMAAFMKLLSCFLTNHIRKSNKKNVRNIMFLS